MFYKKFFFTNISLFLFLGEDVVILNCSISSRSGIFGRDGRVLGDGGVDVEAEGVADVMVWLMVWLMVKI